MKHLLLSGLLFLPLALPVAEANRRYDGDDLHRITTDYVTPHLEWGRPLSGGPIEALFFTNRRYGARDVIELSQRLDMKFDAFVGANFQRIALDNVYESRVEGTAEQEKHAEVRQKLSRPWPIYVMANFPLTALDEEAQYRILKQVSEGSSLVIFYPSQFPFSKVLSEPTEDYKAILSMIDISALPGKGTTIPAEKDLLKTYRFGKGRIALVRYRLPQFGQGLTSREPYTLHGWRAQYENSQALAARVLQWAAGRDLSTVVSLVEPQVERSAGESVPLRLHTSENAKGTLRFRLRDGWNRVVWTEERNVAPEVALELPPLAAGAHYLDVQLLDGNRVEVFGTFHIGVKSPVGTLTITPGKPSYEPADDVSAKVTWETPAPSTGEMRVWIEDLPDRNRWAEQTIEIPKGASEATFTFPRPQIPTVAGALRAELSLQGKPATDAYAVAYFPRRGLEIFPTTFWGTVPSVLPEMFSETLRQASPDAIGTPGNGLETVQLSALFNQRIAPRVIHVHMPIDEQGGTKIRAWLNPSDRKANDEAANGDGSFYNPSMQTFIKELIAQKMAGIPQAGPPYYNLGDENGFSYDAGYSPSEEKAFRRYIEDSYKTIETLNREWGTDFANFDAVGHPRPAEMREKGLYPQWLAHRRFMEKQYAEVHDFMMGEIRKHDPYAIGGAEGSRPGELELTVEKLDFWGPYTDAVGDELMRAVAPNKLRSIWWGYGGEFLAYPLWRPLLSGAVNGNAWYSANVEPISGLIGSDFSLAKFYKNERKPFIDALERGPAQLMIKTPLKPHGIAMLWSHASYSASFMNDRFFNPRDAAVALTNFFYREGLNFDYLTSRMVEAGKLDSYRILFLPGATALSDQEAESIRRFAEKGGIVVADLNPGILNASLGLRQESALAKLFAVSTLRGTESLIMKPVSIKSEVRGLPLAFEAKQTHQSPEVPVFSTTSFGKGIGILLNFNLSSAINTAATPLDDLLLGILKLADIEPEVRIEGINREQLMVRMRAGDGFELLGVLPAKDNLGKTAKISLPRKAWVYEVDKGFVGVKEVIETKLDTPFHLYALFPGEQRPPVLTLSASTISPAVSLGIDARQLAPTGIYRLEVRSPKGEVIPRLTSVFEGRTPPANLRLALNDAPGKYEVTLTDARTGLAAKGHVTLGK